jgi:hypothetical protein
MKKGENKKENSHFELVNKKLFLPNSKCSNSRFCSVIDKLKMFESKRSQITIFIVIAILLVATVSVVFYVSKGSKNEVLQKSFFGKLGFKNYIDEAKDSISQCMISDTQDALKTIGIQGGYYKKPDKYVDLGWAFVPYYYYQGQSLMPSKTNVEEQLSMYVDDKFTGCLNDLGFKDSNIEYKNSNTKVSISKGQIVFKIDMPVSIKKDSEVTTIDLKDNPVVYNSSLYDILEVSDYIIKSHKENNTMICINCVVQMAKERNLYVDILNYPKDKDTVLVMVSENYTSSQPYLFEFLEKY